MTIARSTKLSSTKITSGNNKTPDTYHTLQVIDFYSHNTFITHNKLNILRGAFKIKKRQNLGKVPNRGVIENSKSSQVSVGKSSKRGGGSSKFKKVPSFQKFESLKNNALFPSHEDP